MFKNILAAADNLKDRDPAVLTAARMAELSNGRLHVLHVKETLEPVGDRSADTGEGLPGDGRIDPLGDLQSDRDELRRIYPALGQNPEQHVFTVMSGVFWQVITRYAAKISADLIVTGSRDSDTRPKQGTRKLTGAVSSLDGVIMHGHCPVMIVPARISRAAPDVKKIVVGIDFSASCECALKLSVDLARHFQAKIRPFHMVPIPPIPAYSQADYEADLSSARKALSDFCAGYIEDPEQALHVWGGALPHLEILKLAGDQDADLIVMGSHTKEEQGRWYPGSAVEKVGANSHCPVIVVTDEAALGAREKTVNLKKPA